MLVGLIHQVFKFNKKKCDVEQVNERATANIAQRSSPASNQQSCVNAIGQQQSQCGTGIGGGQSSTSQCCENTNCIYLLIVSLGLCMLGMAIVGLMYINKTTDVATLRTNLESELIISDIKQIVKATLNELRDENFFVIRERYV